MYILITYDNDFYCYYNITNITDYTTKKRIN